MSCKKCKKTKCGCADKPYGIPTTFSNDPTVCPPDSEKCTEVFEAECICWPGPDICELDIKTGDRLDEVLEKLILTMSQVSCAAFEPGPQGDPGTNGLPGQAGGPGTNGFSGRGIAVFVQNLQPNQTDFDNQYSGIEGFGVNGIPGSDVIKAGDLWIEDCI
tara:strand:- start:13336 stop:13818 length:483 start_codon:yes stop_codon:yes gene_type:complete